MEIEIRETAVIREATAIREAEANDLTPLLTLYLSLHEDMAPKSDERLISLWRDILADPFYHIFVAETQGCLVSSVTLCVIRNLTRGMRPYALIENVVTQEPYRHKGFATALLKTAVDCAEAAGCYKVMLLTGSKREETLRFYERAGFNRNDKTAFIKWL